MNIDITNRPLLTQEILDATINGISPRMVTRVANYAIEAFPSSDVDAATCFYAITNNCISSKSDEVFNLLSDLGF